MVPNSEGQQKKQEKKTSLERRQKRKKKKERKKEKRKKRKKKKKKKEKRKEKIKRSSVFLLEKALARKGNIAIENRRKKDRAFGARAGTRQSTSWREDLLQLGEGRGTLRPGYRYGHTWGGGGGGGGCG